MVKNVTNIKSSALFIIFKFQTKTTLITLLMSTKFLLDVRWKLIIIMESVHLNPISTAIKFTELITHRTHKG